MSARTNERIPSVSAFVLLAALAVWHALTAFPLILDDPFITFRYGRQLALGHGLVWNVGEPPVEGFTSPLWMLISAASEKLSVFPLLTTKLLGIASVLGLLAAVLFGTRALLPRLYQRVAAGFLVATCTDFAVLGVSGMENVTFAALVFLLVPLLFREERRVPLLAARWAAALAGVLCWLRPEGNLVALAVAAFFAVEGLRTRDLQNAREYAALTALLVVPLHVARLLIFGHLLPMTYYAKHTGGPLLTTLAGGLRYLGSQGAPFGAFLVLSIAGCWTAGGRTAFRLFGFLIAAFVLFVVVVGGDASAFPGARLLLPVIPLAFVFGLRFLHDAVPGVRPRAAAVAALLVVFEAAEVNAFLAANRPPLAIGELLSGYVPRVLRDARAHWAYLRRPTPLHMSEYMLRETPPGEYIAVPWAGRVPYETMLPTIDLLGLNDPHIASQAKQEPGIDVKADAEYVLSRRPYFVCENLFLAPSSMGAIARMSDQELERVGAWKVGHKQLLKSRQLHEHYEVDPRAPNNPGLGITCFRRR